MKAKTESRVKKSGQEPEMAEVCKALFNSERQ